MLADLGLVPGALAVATRLRATLPLGEGGALPPEAVRLPWFVFAIALLAWSSGLILAGAYDPERVLRWYQEARQVTLASGLALLLMAGGLYFAFRDMSRLQFGYSWALTLLFMLGFRATLRVYYRLAGRSRPGWRSRILIAGAGDLGQRLAGILLDQSRWGLDLVGFLDDDPAKVGTRVEGAPVLGALDSLPEAIRSRRIEEVWIALPARAHERLNQVVALAEKLPVRLKIAPDYFSMALVHARAEILGGIPLIGLREPVIEGTDRIAKRLFDLLVGGLSVLVAALPMAVIALLIRLDSPGPTLFRQKRVGENGRLFDMFKFRTMVRDAEGLQDQMNVETDDGKVLHKRPHDPRVTRIGRFLRRYSLDELPQLFNVVRGEMSLVGPRPEMPWLVDKYEPWQRKRFAVPQGLTGWWQVNGRSDKPMHLHTEDDLYYVYNYSLWLDLRILLMTPLAALRGRGAF
jgi:exopolysaccharide biosynthesis polyprenyl glycosylphosphotransferase